MTPAAAAAPFLRPKFTANFTAKWTQAQKKINP